MPADTQPGSLVELYRNIFGLPDLEVAEGIIAIEIPGLSLFLIEERTFESYSTKAGRDVTYPADGSSVILSCAIESRESLDTMLEVAVVHGGSVPRPAGIDEDMGLYLGYFFEPDGHHWELAHSGGQR